jgi:hypothetical protein
MPEKASFGLTIEDVNAMQEEMNPIGGDKPIEEEVKDKSAKDEKPKADEAKPVDDKEKEKADLAKEGEKKDDEKESDDNADLREQLRQTNSALQKLTADYAKLQKSMVDKGVITDEEVKASKAEEEAATAAYNLRVEKLNDMVAMMELNPAYSDVRDVCAQGNLDDVVDAFARHYVTKNGGDVKVIAAQLESDIWGRPNPYKEMYEVIKKYHPKYAEKKEEVKKDVEKKEEKPPDKKKEPVEANPSAAGLGTGGSGTGAGGWTAARIDALPEDEIQTTVPKDVYDQYLKGTLK